MQAAGLVPEAELVREAGFLRTAFFAVMSSLLTLPMRPTAVIVDNNQAGVGAIRAVVESGLVLGQDCSLIIYEKGSAAREEFPEVRFEAYTGDLEEGVTSRSALSMKTRVTTL